LAFYLRKVCLYGWVLNSGFTVHIEPEVKGQDGLHKLLNIPKFPVSAEQNLNKLDTCRGTKRRGNFVAGILEYRQLA
jgi:hypothetical protein